MIGDVTRALVDLVEIGTPDLGDWVEATSLHKDVIVPTNRLAVSLYAIDEHAHMRNRPQEFDGERYRRPPVVVRLSYVMAYFGGPDENHLDEQDRLDRVVQVFHSTPVIARTAMPARLAADVDKLAVRLWSPTADERNQIWTAFSRPMRLAVYYKVDAVPITTTRDDGGPPIVEQTIEFAELRS